MATYIQAVVAQGRDGSRPSEYEGLLFRPIADDPTSTETSYDGWEIHHGHQPRFRLGGAIWFSENTGLKASNVYERAGKRMMRDLRENTNWWKMINSGDAWNHRPARQQFDRAFGGRPVLFQKAAAVLYACELALVDMLEDDEPGLGVREIIEPYIEQPSDIYRIMTIIPTCWNIDEFDAEFLNALTSSGSGEDHIAAMAQSAGQQKDAIIHDLASGLTVSWETASAIMAYLGATKDIEIPSRMRVRANPGQFLLGRSAASPSESVDRG